MTNTAEDPRVVAITGASGMVGTALTRSLENDGIRVVRFVRRETGGDPNERTWSPKESELDPAALADVDAVVHLAGASIGDRRWTPEVKQLVLQSRVDGTRLLAQTLAAMPAEARPRSWISASAVGYYGDTGERVVDESGPLGTGFLAEVCEAWEGAAQAAKDAGMPVAHARIGVILSAQGGALAQMLTPFKLGLGGVVGSGKQGFPWVSLNDVVRAIRFLLRHPELRGPYNLAGPQLRTNAEFTKALGAALRRPTVIPLPGFLARAGLGRDMANELLLQGQRVVPKALLDAGFQFEEATLEAALKRALA